MSGTWPLTRTLERDFTPVFSPVISAARQDDSATRFLAIVPSLGDAIEALNYVYDDLAQALKQFLDCSTELASKDHSLANVPEVCLILTFSSMISDGGDQMLDVPDAINYDNLSTSQRIALVENELRKWQHEARSRAQSLFRKLKSCL